MEFKRLFRGVFPAFGTGFLTLCLLISLIPGLISGIISLEKHAATVSPARYGLEYSSVVFPSRDGLLLDGWLLGNRTDEPVVILVHGFGANRAEPADRVFDITKRLLSEDFNVFMFDLRAQGESQGDRVSGGLYERNDLLGAIDYLRSRGYTAKIGVMGFSMGAATSLLTAAISPDISAVVADSSFTNVVSVIHAQFDNWGVPEWLLPGVELFSRFLYGLDMNAVSPLDALQTIKVPVFIIHGGNDNLIPTEQAFELKEVCQNPESELWVIPQAGHTDGFSVMPADYLNRVSEFFELTLESGSIQALTS